MAARKVAECVKQWLQRRTLGESSLFLTYRAESQSDRVAAVAEHDDEAASRVVPQGG